MRHPIDIALDVKGWLVLALVVLAGATILVVAWRIFAAVLLG